MSYLLVVVIGTVAGWVGGQFLKGNEEGVTYDLIAGAVGAVVAVVVSRLVGPPSASGYLLSILFALMGSVGALYAMRRVMKARLAPVPRARRR